MASRSDGHLLVFLVCSVLVSLTTAAANLDTIGPILKTSPGAGGVDEFGYSVLLHRISTPTNSFESFLNNTRYGRIYVYHSKLFFVLFLC